MLCNHRLQETIALSNDRKYLANRVIGDSSHGTSIARRERIDLVRVCCGCRCRAAAAADAGAAAVGVHCLGTVRGRRRVGTPDRYRRARAHIALCSQARRARYPQRIKQRLPLAKQLEMDVLQTRYARTLHAFASHIAHTRTRGWRHT